MSDEITITLSCGSDLFPYEKQIIMPKKKEEIKTAQAYGCNEVRIYSGYVDCPYCGDINSIEYNHLPFRAKCQSCQQQFQISWE